MSSPNPSMAEPPARSAWPLVISLCLNVALVAMIAVAVAATVFRPQHPRWAWAAGPLGPYALLGVASPAEKPKIQAIIDAHKLRLQELTDEAGAARRQAFFVFAQPSFDAAAYQKALDRVRDANDALQIEAGHMLADASAQLSPGERAALAEKVRKRRWWFWGRFHGGWD